MDECKPLVTGFNPLMQTRAGAAGAVEAVQAAGARTHPLLSSTWQPFLLLKPPNVSPKKY